MWNEAKKYFCVRRFFYLSLTHAPIFHRSMQMLWMQQNIWCIILATFKMIAMSSARSASILSVVKPKQPSGSGRTNPASCEFRPYVLSRPKPTPLNPPLILLMSRRHRCPHIKRESPSGSDLLIDKCGKNAEDMCENGLWGGKDYACFISVRVQRERTAQERWRRGTRPASRSAGCSKRRRSYWPQLGG